ncbi:Alpha/beta hydrolase family protein [Rosistilla ulvae]|uniref:Alpha/beta hydrolase family protein n=1 Tax=Rosistilla ulvae TaxID=1930277 RepID=A0A517M0H3_9BACT|nr:alpha/beta hydrolase [Rosistilla ulvae]QDS88381.1 Alpha/beta hydrolase family protein [Rosistilla ulvae]
MRKRLIPNLLCHAVLLVAITGCGCMRSDRLQSPTLVKPSLAGCWHDGWLGLGSLIAGQGNIDDFERYRLQASLHPTAESSTALGERAYAVAERLHGRCDHRAVDYWAQTIAWLDDGQRRCGLRGGKETSDRIARVRHSALIRILSCGQKYGRLDPASHLTIHTNAGPIQVPIVHHGFPWRQSDFQRLMVFESPASALGNVCGRGVPLIVFTSKTTGQQATNGCGEACDACCTVDPATNNRCQRFLDSRLPFAATALLDLPVSLFQGAATRAGLETDRFRAATMRLVNPLGGDLPEPCDGIAKSPAMPLYYARQNSQYSPVVAFMGGDNGVDRPELKFLEPYQPDKIPLLLVHGLLSNPATFLEVADAVRADPVLSRRYQIWVFRYPTGDDFFESTAILREQLAAAFACHPDGPNQQNPRHRAVIVGHSLGGLVAKLQVTDSGDRLWRSIANGPLEQMRASPQEIAGFRRSFFFKASPNIGRVVYIATPHRGSPWAARCIGRIGSSLAGFRSDDKRKFQNLVAANPGLFSGAFTDSLPSSVDLLRPSSRLLQALAATPSSPRIDVHSIIGDCFPLPRSGPSDTVVPVSSAYRKEAVSTAYIDATHTSILRSNDAQQALLEILRLHIAESASAGCDCRAEDPTTRLLAPIASN